MKNYYSFNLIHNANLSEILTLNIYLEIIQIVTLSENQQNIYPTFFLTVW